MSSTPLGAEQLRTRLDEQREPLVRRVSELPESHADVGLALGRAHAEVLDDLLTRLYPVAFEAALGDANVPAPLALAGVGGYGRGAVALGSDLDVRLLAVNLDQAEEVANKLLYPLWDSGLPVGHQVVTADDLLSAARDDLPTATSLLDWRHVAGDERLSQRLHERAATGIFAPGELGAFIQRLEREGEQRHRRFGGSVYLLEPDVKNGPGGLRDLDVARWAARARWGVGDVDDLVRYGVFVPRHLRAVSEAREQLWRIRNVLHELAGRRSDRLTFDAQEALAARFGYGDHPGEAVERLMSDYYRAARTISRFRDIVLARAMPTRRRRRPSYVDLGDGIVLFDGEVALRSHEQLKDDPASALRVVAAAVDQRVRIRPGTRGAIVALCGDTSWSQELRDAPDAARTFVELVTCCGDVELKAGSVMRELHDLGILLAMIPEFAPVVGRVHHDTYHVYTVDVHSVAALDRLVEIVRGEVVLDCDEENRWVDALACRLGAEISQPTVLFFATLLHDIGKAIGRRDHSERGAELAQAILPRLGFESAQIEDVCRLIENHLKMYLTATRRDLDDPHTLSEFASVVRNREGLRDLYLLTVADLSTTSPTSMTSWKARMLDDLFVATNRYFREGTGEDRVRLDQRRALVLSASSDEATCRAYLDGMPDRYLLANPAQAIVAHSDLVSRYLHGSEAAAVDIVPSRHHDVDEVCIVTDDRPGLLAAITAALGAGRLHVHGAQIFSCEVQHGGAERTLAVDVFWLHHGPEGSPSPIIDVLDKLREDLAKVLGGEVQPRELLLPRRRGGSSSKQPPVATKVMVDNRASAGYTVVEVITRDRQGLLFALADALHELGYSIAVAKIATEGTRVVDVFYLGEPDGKKVSLERRGELTERLLALIEELDAA